MSFLFSHTFAFLGCLPSGWSTCVFFGSNYRTHLTANSDFFFLFSFFLHPFSYVRTRVNDKTAWGASCTCSIPSHTSPHLGDAPSRPFYSLIPSLNRASNFPNVVLLHGSGPQFILCPTQFYSIRAKPGRHDPVKLSQLSSTQMPLANKKQYSP